MGNWIALARPRQWSKNLLLYAAFLFTAGDAWGFGESEALTLFARATLAFVALCALSSAGYLLNDVRDAALDREHPRKRLRPVAAGHVSPRRAVQGAWLFVAAGLALSAPLGAWFVAAAIAYLVGTVAYTLALKRVPLVDVTAVAGLFALRALAGALAIEVAASPWILVCTFAGALFVAGVKRQQEQWLLGAHAPAHRETLTGGSRWPRWVVGSAAIATAGLYLAYTVTAANLPDNGSMVATVPFVVAALARYYVVARRHPHRDAEEVAFRDPIVLALVVGFVALAVMLLGGA